MKHKHPHSMLQDLQDAMTEISKRTQWHPETFQESIHRNNWVTNYAMRWVGEVERWFREDSEKKKP